jgi:predicted RNA binding protein YcfA (HicA-like mRNA interferase family)
VSALDRLIEAFVCRPESVTIADVRRLLSSFGYQEKKKPGSECVFHKKGSYPINVPTLKGRKVKKQYIKLIVQKLDLEDLYERGTRNEEGSRD